MRTAFFIDPHGLEQVAYPQHANPLATPAAGVHSASQWVPGAGSGANGNANPRRYVDRDWVRPLGQTQRQQRNLRQEGRDNSWNDNVLLRGMLHTDGHVNGDWVPNFDGFYGGHGDWDTFHRSYPDSW
jgi:hypothetical protein